MTTDYRDPARMGALEELRTAAIASHYVSMGSRRLTSVHEFYRYPGRFTPAFARAAIAAFSSPGQLVLDPFVGGGTTLVEARLATRLAIGADINHLATFVSEAKTATPTAREIALVRSWAAVVDLDVRLIGATRRPPDWDAGGYFAGLASPGSWRIRDFLIRAVAALPENPRASLLARCALLRSAQWALDIRRDLPTLTEFRAALVQDVIRVADASERFTSEARTADGDLSIKIPRTTIVHSAAAGLREHPSLRQHPGASLILTSPPYPGVYVLYHRWKLRGRREISTPYWLAGTPDGHGLSHYTLGARARLTLDHYFERLTEAFKDAVALALPGAFVVQLIGFNDVEAQLPPYLEVMNSIGLREMTFPELATAADGRLWRDVPSRRWWVTARSKQAHGKHTAREVVLIHRLTSAVRHR